MVRVLRWRARHEGDLVAHVFLADGELEEARLTYAELDARARGIAAALREKHQPGERALLLYPAGLDFVAAFFGCLYAGLVAVPAYPPRNRSHMARIQAIVRDARGTLALTTAKTIAGLRAGADEGLLATLEWMATDGLAPADFAGTGGEPGDLAFLQYTSGSTGTPKGVMVTHANIAYNSLYIRESFSLSQASVSVSWLPSFHDMGLIDGVIQPVATGFPGVLLSPVSFIQKPVRWLQAITRYGGTHGGGPNFGYDLCTQKVTDEQLAELDLHTLQSLYNGAEPVRPQTMARFARRFAACGFSTRAFYPCYGLAETTLMVTGGQVTRDPELACVDRVALEQGLVREVAAGTPGAIDLAGSGRTILDTTVVVVDPEAATPLPPDRVGEVWVAGPTVCSGYWERPEETRLAFGAHLASGEGPFLRTGDLGFVRNGELFVTGRHKDLVIVAGRNHYPQDIEWTAERAHPALRASCGAAFSVEVDGEERLVVAHEVERLAQKGADVEAIARAIARAVAEEHEVAVYAVAVLKTGTLPKTSSGKTQRRQCRDRWLSGELSLVGSWTAPVPAPPAVAVAGAAVVGFLQERVGARTGRPAHDVACDTTFQALGLDSVAAVGISGELSEWLGRPLSPSLLYDYPTIDRLAVHLRGHDQPERRQPAPRRREREDVAIVGTGCRLPGGVSDRAGLWALLQEGRDAVGDVPAGRFDTLVDPTGALPGTATTRRGGYLTGAIDRFDADFFGISAREAAGMDPQQRLLLEVAWEALEDAGLVPRRLAGSSTGVYVGISTHDYAGLKLHAGAADSLDAYDGTGNAFSAAAGRLSYLLDLQGPSLAVDTACSSSLVAVHLACQALLAGECDTALAGGVNLILGPELAVAFARAGMTSAGGACRSFDDAADGFVRAEGCGVVVLRRLSDALAAGDRVLAVIRGSAVNQDGRSNGLTAPNGPSQERVIHRALDAARVTATDISYVEAHGSGTPLGDSIEAGALGAVFAAPGRTPLLVGSVKSNLGHLEAAAGITGLLKAVVALEHEAVPPSLHFTSASSRIDWSSLPLAVPTREVPWPRGETPRRAGVSSFGFTGTNAHVVLEEGPLLPAPAGRERKAHVLPLSARTPEALEILRGQYLALLEHHPFEDVCVTAALERTHFEHRLAVAGGAAREVAELLRRAPARRADPPRLAFLFTGQGAQQAGMARTLLAQEPVFRDAFLACDEILGRFREGSLRAVVEGEVPGLDDTAWTQPALFAWEWALAALWRSLGVTPSAVLGHSVGGYVAACMAGVFPLEDALRLVEARGRLMGALPAGGGMLAVHAGEETLGELPPGVAVAAVNGPDEVVLSGPLAALEVAARRLAAAGVRTQPLRVSHAFHSPLMDVTRAAFAEVLAGVRFQAPSLDVVSDLTGRVAGPEIATAAYWLDHLAGTVRFADGLRTLQASRCTLAVEIGPRPVLSALAVKAGLACLPSRRPRVDDEQQVAETLGALYTAGVPVSWDGFYGGVRHRRVALPTYPFQRERHWVPERRPAALPAGDGVLGHRVDPTTALRGAAVWHTGRAMAEGGFPLATHLGLALAAAVAELGAGPLAVRDVEVFGTGPDAAPLDVAWHPLGDRAEVRVSVAGGAVRAAARVERRHTRQGPELGVMFFNGTEEALRHRYRLVLESARFADRHGFSSVWVPERHYTAFGGLYPNPAVLQAALARETRGLRLMAGSMVAPLHHPLRAAEDWALVDNLSDGRVGVSLASGWNPDDFASAPGRYADRHEEVFRSLDLLRRLWRGETIPGTSGTGKAIDVRIYPTPVQAELPVWITAASNPRTFERAGEVGAHVLTHLLDQDPDALAEKISLYRAARARAGHDPAAGRVSIMLHTFLGEDVETVREQVRRPYCAYIEANLGLLKGLAKSRGRDLDVDALSPQDRAAFVSFLYDRFFDTRALLGTPESCRPLVERLQAAGVDEIACLLDFGPPTDDVLASLPHLARLNDMTRGPAVVLDTPVVALRDVRARCTVDMPAPVFARRLREQGIETGETLRVVDVFHRRDGEALCALAGGTDATETLVLNAALLAVAAALPEDAFTHTRDGVLVPVSAGTCTRHRAGRAAWAHARVEAGDAGFVAGVVLCDADGHVLVSLQDVVLRRQVTAEATAVDDTAWTYEVEWREKPLAATPATAPGRWLVLADSGGVGLALARRLEARGDAAVVIGPGQPVEIGPGAWRGVVHLRTLDAAPTAALDPALLAQAEDLGPGTLLSLVQELARRPARIHVVTRGAQPVEGAVREVAQAPVWGLGRVVALEHPECWGGLVDLPEGSPETLAALLEGELGSSDGEDQVAWRNGSRYVPRLQPCRIPEAPAPAFSAEAAYLVTGGLGGLGRRIANWMVRHGARDLVLTGVRALPAESADPAVRERLAAVRSLEAQGARVTVVQADAADRVATEHVFRTLESHGRPLRGVVHLAGLPENRTVAETDFARDRAVLSPKVTGAWLLHDLVGTTPLDFFVTFSSISAVWGSRGQPLYAAANHFLDALASSRRGMGRPSLNVSWGPWSEGGMVDAEGLALLGRMGVQPLEPGDATRVLGRLLVRGDAPAVVANVDWAVFKDLFEARGRRPLLDELGRRSSLDAGPGSELMRQVELAPGPERHAMLLAHVRGEVASVLGWPSTKLPEPRRGFFEMGMDSLMALDLKNRLQTLLGRPLRATVVFNHATAEALTGFLLEEFAPVAVPTAEVPPATEDASEAELLRAFDAQLAAVEAGLTEHGG